jgi:3-deoxy-manno-octulosonate cytidylyltransferase (CMP-KDO synthetase)
VAEAVERLLSEGIDPIAVVNIQGDEPLIEPQLIDTLVEPLLGEEPPEMLTAATVNPELADLLNPAVCKVVCDSSGRALYFSRSLIPYNLSEIKERDGEYIYLRHIGIYAYRRDFLNIFTKLAPGPLERAEKLEMLRALEHGYTIRLVKTKYRSIGVDTEEQLNYVRKVFADEGLAEKILAGE